MADGSRLILDTIAAAMLLYYITDRKAFPGDDSARLAALLRKIGEAARAGVDYIQLREKDLSARSLEQLTRDALLVVRQISAATRLLVNGRSDIAIACQADGVHLPGGELSVAEVRSLWKQAGKPDPPIGVSAHSLEDVLAAQAEGADLVVLAPIFEKVETHTTGIGLDALRAACSRLQSGPPVFALGGVNVENARACMDAGASGVAGIRLFQEGDLSATVRVLRAMKR